MRGLCIPSTEPELNLAIEEHLFHTLPPDDEGWFLLWRTAPSIIVGRHQNTAQEVHQNLVYKYRLPVVRRITGGGAVYHDLGNINYSFITPQDGNHKIDFGVFLHPIQEALRELGVQAQCSGRNDLTVNDKKISGSAQLRRHGKVLHHGTLLVQLDLDMLGAVLAGHPDKYLSKGVASVRSRVCNLAEVLPQGVGMAEVQQALLRRCADSETSLSAEALAAANTLAQEKYRTWAWNYGASPAFTETRRHRFPWGAVELCLEVDKGRIKSCRVYGDFFAREDLSTLEKRLVGVQPQPEHLREALQGVVWEAFFAGCEPAVMEAFFCTGQEPQ